MSYQGGKQQLGKRIYKIISTLEGYLYQDDYLPYFEPFVGFCGVLKHFAQDDRYCSGCDANKDIIAMWKATQHNWKPPTTCSKRKYEALKERKTHSAERGFIGVACSYSGIFYVGFRGTQTFRNNGKERIVSSAEMTARSVNKIAGKVKNVDFLNAQSYDNFKPSDTLIYCDPPYEDNKYQQSKFFNFDSDKFWNTMRKWSENNLVVISERKSPSDFQEIWSSQIGVNHNGKQQKHKECLYVHNSIYSKLTPNIIYQLKHM